jgi:multisubunit Na+/H+ antiporter MnhG subunit
MGVTTAAIVVLLGTGVLLQLLSIVGVLVASDVFDRLHFTGPSALGVVAIALAVLIDEGLSVVGAKSLVIAALLVTINAVLTHATGRAARVRQFGHWAAMPEERVER